MNILKNISYLFVFSLLLLVLTLTTVAQDRQRVVKPISSQPVTRSTVQQTRTRPLTSSKPVNAPKPPILENKTVLPAPLVKKTGESRPTSSMITGARSSLYSSAITTDIMSGITKKLRIPYLYGSTGPNRYDCSGFVWAVFNEAGIKFTRQSARSLWSISEPVDGDEKYKFGTLIFLNKLGHMGIVADENGFYHASSSKGITYSPFKGYWEKRIVGFRRLVTKDETPAERTQ